MPQEEQQSEEAAPTVHVQSLSNKLPSGDDHGSENSAQQSDVRRNGLKKRPGKGFMRCPRCWALILGVILPLWLLIAVSFAFGYGLAVLEAEPELDQNDEILMNQAMGIFETVSVTNITQRLPIMCLEAFIANRTISDMADDLFIDFLPSMPYDGNLQHNFAAPPPPLITHKDAVSVFIENNANMTYNLAELLQFLQHCSASSESYVKDMIAQLTSTSSVIRATAEMSFYWNRCPLVLNETARNQSALDAFLQESIIFQSISTGYQQSLHPSSQSSQYKNEWNKDAAALYFHALNQTDFTRLNASEAAEVKYSIFLSSIDQATGRSGCYPNTVASVWFWFTVMTTIGYGNQAPVTWQGRTMVFTLGFVNILLFGAIAASGGYVLTSLANDKAARWGVPLGSKPWLACIMWAVLLYIWMLLIAYVYQQWKLYRLNEVVDMDDAYWFAYISTTTVGLGDLYLDPEVLVLQDILSFPVLLLISFSFFGSFITELGTALYRPFKERTTLVDVLKESGVLMSKPSWHAKQTLLELSEAEKRPAVPEASSTTRLAEESKVPAKATETLAVGSWRSVDHEFR